VVLFFASAIKGEYESLTALLDGSDKATLGYVRSAFIVVTLYLVGATLLPLFVALERTGVKNAAIIGGSVIGALALAAFAV
jgi:hypothetical protein